MTSNDEATLSMFIGMILGAVTIGAVAVIIAASSPSPCAVGEIRAEIVVAEDKDIRCLTLDEYQDLERKGIIVTPEPR